MKHVILVLLTLSAIACTTKQPAFGMGQRVLITEGFFKGCTGWTSEFQGRVAPGFEPSYFVQDVHCVNGTWTVGTRVNENNLVGAP